MTPYSTASLCTTHKFIEFFFTYKYIMGVRAEYDSIRTRLFHSSSTVTMAQALSDLLAGETRLKSMSSSASVSYGVLAVS